jgi:Subtilase family
MSATLVHGIDDLVRQEVPVINLSLGPAVLELATDDPIALAVERARIQGTLVVCAAGNWGPAPGTLQGLARLPGVLSVGALDEAGRLLESSSRGVEGGQHPTLCARGNPPLIAGLAQPAAGTSFAAAKVSGAAAAMRSMLDALWHDFDDLRSGHAWSWTSELSRPALGLADTGIDPAALATVPLGMGAAWQGGSTIRLARAEASRTWCLALQQGLKDLNLGCSLEVSGDRVGAALVLACRPLPGEEPPWAGGAGWLDDEACVDWLQHFTPVTFAALFGPMHQSEQQVEGLHLLTRAIGSRWNANEARTTYNIFREGLQISVAKVI